MLHIQIVISRQDGEGRFQVFGASSPNVGQTHNETPNRVRVLYMLRALYSPQRYEQITKKQYHKSLSDLILHCKSSVRPRGAQDLSSATAYNGIAMTKTLICVHEIKVNPVINRRYPRDNNDNNNNNFISRG